MFSFALFLSLLTGAIARDDSRLVDTWRKGKRKIQLHLIYKILLGGRQIRRTLEYPLAAPEEAIFVNFTLSRRLETAGRILAPHESGLKRALLLGLPRTPQYWGVG